MSIPIRKIGKSSVTEIGFGAMGIASFYGAVSAPAKRNDIFLATKFGIGATGVRGDPAFVKEQCATSLARLGVDSIDLYYQHRVDPNTPIEVGKVKELGLSECSAKALRRAHAVHPIAAVQIEYSPFVLDIEDPKIALLATARELGVTIVAYSPLGRGLLTGRYKSPADFAPDDFRHTVPKFSAANFPKILDVVSGLHKIGEKHNATAGQVTLAWILAQGPEFVVIPGTKKIKYLEENLGASAVKLSTEDVAAVRQIAEATEIPGDRNARMATMLIDSVELPK
ncbi:NADP-dependent oxidoreductase domain-containing protein [Mycena olivaceomarginata]|nr:NADP-dependent oxidoreductase domain-containing protein [Mycena olivaceomarginata]